VIGGLLLERNIGERIMIGDDIIIAVEDIKQINGSPVVRLRILAPQAVKVDREELRIRKEFNEHD
jgi:carbon storage regulator CsrA